MVVGNIRLKGTGGWTSLPSGEVMAWFLIRVLSSGSVNLSIWAELVLSLGGMNGFHLG